MMQPINYNIDVGNPFQSALQGYQVGGALQQQDLKRQQMQQEMIQQQEMQKDLAELARNPSPSAQDFLRVNIKYPKLSEHFKNIMAPLSEEQRQQKISTATQVSAAINSGSIDIALDILGKQKAAAKNSGRKEEEDSAEAMMRIIKANPAAANVAAASFLSAALGPKEFTAAWEAMQKTPVAVEKMRLENENLPIKQRLENEGAFQDIEGKKLKRELDILDMKIKSANSETDRADLELKRDKMLQEFDTKKQEKQVESQGALTAVNQQLETVNKILANPMLEGGIAEVGSVWRPLAAHIPGTDAKDLEELVETVRSQQFLSNLAQLKAQGGTLGQVTEKEGMRLEKALASLSTDQSPKAFKAAGMVIKRSLETIQRQIIAQGNLPKDTSSSGGSYVMQHPKYGVVSEATVNKLLESKPGMTRQQVLQFLKDSGGK